MTLDDSEVRDFVERNRHLIPAGDTDWYADGCLIKEAFWDKARLGRIWEGMSKGEPGEAHPQMPNAHRERILQLWETAAKGDDRRDWRDALQVGWHDALLKAWGLSLEERLVYWLLTNPQTRLPGKSWAESDGMPEYQMKWCLSVFQSTTSRMSEVSHIAAQSRATFYRIAERLQLLK